MSAVKISRWTARVLYVRTNIGTTCKASTTNNGRLHTFASFDLTSAHRAKVIENVFQILVPCIGVKSSCKQRVRTCASEPNSLVLLTNKQRHCSFKQETFVVGEFNKSLRTFFFGLFLFPTIFQQLCVPAHAHSQQVRYVLVLLPTPCSNVWSLQFWTECFRPIRKWTGGKSEPACSSSSIARKKHCANSLRLSSHMYVFDSLRLYKSQLTFFFAVAVTGNEHHVLQSQRRTL